MSKVIPLNSNFVTPEIVIDSVKEKLAEIKEIYVVNLRHDGTWEMYASGNLKDIFGASVHLQNLASSVMRDMSFVEE